jgi:putative nucleotidyltransferase with HDIG domain
LVENPNQSSAPTAVAQQHLLKRSGSPSDPFQSEASAQASSSKQFVDLFIGLLAFFSLLFFMATHQTTNLMYRPLSATEWISLIVISALIGMSEFYSVDLYFQQTAISASVIPILVGCLLFGPWGAFVVSLVAALALLVKYRNPLSRFFFHFSNHLLAGMICTFLVLLTGKQFLELNAIYQLLLSLVSAVMMWLTTTWVIAVGMSLDLKQPAQQIWKEKYSWLALPYIGFGLIAYTLIVGYKYDQDTGLLLMAFPMVLLHLSQKQYMAHTKKAVVQLREKNQVLKKDAEEIAALNDGLLEMLSQIIDLRDPHGLDHSKQVSAYAAAIARNMKLSARQVELIRKGALLHDIGKLGVPAEILAKPYRLTAKEYEIIKCHASLGADLLEKSPSLRPLMPIVRHHHEFFDGNGYPDQLKGNQINIEARIVAVADAIETMSSDRPYRRALNPSHLINELKKHAGSQFDPLIVDKVIRMIETQEGAKLAEEESSSDLLRKSMVIPPPSSSPKSRDDLVAFG